MAKSYYSTQWAGLAEGTIVATMDGVAVIGTDAFSVYSEAKAAGEVTLCDVFCSKDWASAVGETVDIDIEGDTYSLTIGTQAFATFEAAAAQTANNQYGGVNVYAGTEETAASVYFSAGWNELEDYSVVFVGNTVWDADGEQVSTTGGTAIIGVNAFGTKSKADTKAAAYAAQTAVVTTGSSDIYLDSAWVAGSVEGETVSVTLPDGSVVTAVYGANAALLSGSTPTAMKESVADIGGKARSTNQTLYFVNGSFLEANTTSNGGYYTWGAKAVVAGAYVQRLSAGSPYEISYKLAPEVYMYSGAKSDTVYVSGYAQSDYAYLYVGKGAYVGTAMAGQSTSAKYGVITVDVIGGTVGLLQGNNIKLNGEWNLNLVGGTVTSGILFGVSSASSFNNLACDVNITITDHSIVNGTIRESHRDYGRDGWTGTFNVSIKDVNITISDSYVKAISNSTSAWSFRSFNINLDGGTVDTLTPRLNTNDYSANYLAVIGGTAAITGGSFTATAGGASQGENVETDWIDADVRFLTLSSTTVTYNADGTITVKNGIFYNAAATDSNKKWIVGGTATFVGGTHNLVTLNVTGNRQSVVKEMRAVEAITIDAAAELLVKTTYNYDAVITIDATGFDFAEGTERKLLLTTPGTNRLTGGITVVENGEVSTRFATDREDKELYLEYRKALISGAWQRYDNDDIVTVDGKEYTLGVDAFKTEKDAIAAGWEDTKRVDIYANAAWAGTAAGETVYAVLFDGSTVAAKFGTNAFADIASAGTKATSKGYNLYVIGDFGAAYSSCGQPTAFSGGYIPGIYAASNTPFAEVSILGGTVAGARASTGTATTGYLYIEDSTVTGNITPGDSKVGTATIEIVGSTIGGTNGANITINDAYNLILKNSVSTGTIWVGTSSGSNLSCNHGDVNISLEKSTVNGSISFSNRSTSFWAGAFSVTMQDINISLTDSKVSYINVGGSTPWDAVKSLTLTFNGGTTTQSSDLSQITTEITAGTVTFVSGGTVVTLEGAGGSIKTYGEVLEAGATVEGNLRWVGGTATYNADGSVTIVGNKSGKSSSESALLYIGKTYYSLQNGESVTVTGGTYAKKTIHITGGSSSLRAFSGIQEMIIDAGSYLDMVGSIACDTISVDVTGYTGGDSHVVHFASNTWSWNLQAVENGEISKRYTVKKNGGYDIYLYERFTFFAGAWKDLSDGDKVTVNGKSYTIGTDAFTTYAAAVESLGGYAKNAKVGDFFVNGTWTEGETVTVTINDENIDFVVNATNAFNNFANACAAYTAAGFNDGSFTVSGDVNVDESVTIGNFTLDAAAKMTFAQGKVLRADTITIDATNYALADNERKLLIHADATMAGNYILKQTDDDYYLSLEGGDLYLTHAPVYYSALWADKQNGDTVTVDGKSYTIGIDAFSNYNAAKEAALAKGGAVRDLDTYFSTTWSAGQVTTVNARGGSYYALVGDAAKGWINAYTTRALANTAHKNEYPDGGIVVTGGTYTARTQLDTDGSTPVIYTGMTSTASADQSTMLFKGTARGVAGGGYAVIGGSSSINALLIAPRNSSYLQGEIVLKVVDNAKITALYLGGLYDGHVGNPSEKDTAKTTTVTVTVSGASIGTIYGGGYSSQCYADVTINAINTRGNYIYGSATLEADRIYGDMTVNLTGSTYGLISWYNGSAPDGLYGKLTVNVVAGTSCVIDGLVLRNTDALTIKAGAYLYTRSICVNNATETRYSGTITVDATGYAGDRTMFFQTRLGGDYTLAVVGNEKYKIAREAIGDGHGYYLQEKVAYFAGDWKDLADGTDVRAGNETVKIGEYAFKTYAEAQATGYKMSVGDFFVNDTWTAGETIQETINGEVIDFVVDESNAFTSAGAAYNAYKQAAFSDGSFTVETGTHTIDENVSVKHLTVGSSVDLTTNDLTATGNFALASGAKLTAGAMTLNTVDAAANVTINAASISAATLSLGLNANVSLTGNLTATGNFTLASGAELTAGALTLNTVDAAANVTINAASISAATLSLAHSASVTLTGALTATGAVTIDATGLELAPGASKLVVAATSVSAGSFVVLENGTVSDKYVANVKADGLYLQETGVNIVNTAWRGLANDTVVKTAYGDRTLGVDAFASFEDAVAAGKSLDSLVTMDANYNTAWEAGKKVTLAEFGGNTVSAVVLDGNAYYLYNNNAYTSAANATANKNVYAIAHSYGATASQTAVAYTTYDGRSRKGMVYDQASLAASEITYGTNDIYFINSTVTGKIRGVSSAVTNGSAINYYFDNTKVSSYTGLSSNYAGSLSIDLNSYVLMGDEGWWTFDTNLVLVNGSTITALNPYGRGGNGTNAWLDVHGSFNLTVDDSYVGSINNTDEWGTADFYWENGFNVNVRNGGYIATLRFSNKGANNVSLKGGTVGSLTYLGNKAARTISGKGYTYEREAVSVGTVTFTVTGGKESAVIGAFNLRAADAAYSGRANADNLSISDASTLRTSGAMTNAGVITIGGTSALNIATTFGNSGVITIDGASELTSGGAMTNSGSITIDGTSELTSGGAMTNTGSITITAGSLITVKGALTNTSGSITVDATDYTFAPGVYQIKVIDTNSTLTDTGITLVGGSAGMSLFVQDGDLYYGEKGVKFTILASGMEDGEKLVLAGNTYTVGTDVFASVAAAAAKGHHVFESLDIYVNDAWADLDDGKKVTIDFAGYTATIGVDAFAATPAGQSKAETSGGVLLVAGNTVGGATIKGVDTRYNGVTEISSTIYGNTTDKTAVDQVKLNVSGGTEPTAMKSIILVSGGTVNNADITLDKATGYRIWGVQAGAQKLAGTLTLNASNSTFGCFTLAGNESAWSGITSFVGNAIINLVSSTFGVIGTGYRNVGAVTDENSARKVKDYTVNLTDSFVGAIGVGSYKIGSTDYESNSWIAAESFTVNLSGSTIGSKIDGSRTTTTTKGGAATISGGTHTGEEFLGSVYYNIGGTQVFNSDGSVSYAGGTHFADDVASLGGTMTVTGGETAKKTVNIVGGSNYIGSLINMNALTISVGDYLAVGGTLSQTLTVTVDARDYEMQEGTYRVAVISSANSTFSSTFNYLQDDGDENVFTIVGDTLYYGERDTVVSREWVDRGIGETVYYKGEAYTIGTDAFATGTAATAANRHYIVNADTFVYLGAEAGDTVSIDGLDYTVYNAKGNGRVVFTSAGVAAQQLTSIDGNRVVITGGTGSSRQWLSGAKGYIENCTHYWVDGGGIVGSSDSATESTSVIFASGATVSQYWSTHGANVQNAYAEVRAGAVVGNLCVSYSNAVVTNADYRVLEGAVVGNISGCGCLGEGGIVKYTVTGGTVAGNIRTGSDSKDTLGVKSGIIVTLNGATVCGGLLAGAGGSYVSTGDYVYTIDKTYIGGTFGYTGTGGADMASMTMANFTASIIDSQIGVLSLGRVSTTAGAFDITIDNSVIGGQNLSLTAPGAGTSLKGINATLRNMTRATGNAVVIDAEANAVVQVDGDINVNLEHFNLTAGAFAVTNGATGSVIGGDITVNATDVEIGTSIYILNCNTADAITTTGDVTLNFNGVTTGGVYFSTRNDAATAIAGARKVNFTGGTSNIARFNEKDAVITINAEATLAYGNNVADAGILTNLVNNGAFVYTVTGLAQNTLTIVATNYSGNGSFSATDGGLKLVGTTLYTAAKQDVMMVKSDITGDFGDTIEIGGVNYIYGVSAFATTDDAAASEFHGKDTTLVVVGQKIDDPVYGNGHVEFNGSTVTKSVYAGEAVSDDTVSADTSVKVVGGTYAALIGAHEVTGAVTQSGDSAVTISGGNDVSGKAIVGSSYVTNGTLTLEDSTSSVTIESGSFSSIVVGGALANKENAYIEGAINTEVLISGGTVKAVCGGCYLQGTTTEGEFFQGKISVGGTSNVTISGGVIENSVFGGNLSKFTGNSTAATSTWDGDTNVTIDVSGENKVYIGSHIVAGSEGKGLIGGNTQITFTGNGANLTVKGHIVGGSSSGTDGSAPAASGVTGSRTLTFNEFEGTIGSAGKKVIGFTNVEVNKSTVTIIGYGQLKSVGDWNISNGTIGWTQGTNDFSGDKLYLNYSGGELTDEWTVFQLADGLTTNWDGFITDSEVEGNPSIHLQIGEFNDFVYWNSGEDAYVTSVAEGQNYKFYLDETNHSLKLAKLA